MSQFTDQPAIISPWRKGSLSNTLQNCGCVEAARNGLGGLSVRDTKNPDQPPLHFDATETGVFFQAVRDGEFGEFPLP